MLNAHLDLPLGSMPRSATRAPPAAVSAGSHALAVNGGTSLRVLLIEDDPINAFVASEYLRNSGINDIVHVETLADLEAQADNILDDEYDLLLVDIMLPDGLSTEFLKRLRSRGCRCPIAAYTARDTEDDLNEYRACGVDHVFSKPLSFESFEVGLERLFSSSRRS